MLAYQVAEDELRAVVEFNEGEKLEDSEGQN